MAELRGDTTEANIAGVFGESTNTTNAAGPGVHGKSAASGVIGESTTWHGIAGLSQSTTGGAGVYGQSQGTGVIGESTTWMGVYGKSESTTGGAGVMGEAVGSGVIGKSTTWMGVYGKSESTTGGAGVMGEAVGPGVIGTSQTWMGVYGETKSTTGGAGVWGEHKNGGVGVVGVSENDTGVGVLAKGGRLAGLFEGDVDITGNLIVKNFIYMNGDTAHSLQSWTSRIQHLEAQVANLLTVVADLRSRVPAGGSSPAPTVPTATIGVEMILQSGPSNTLRVFGSGFTASEQIEIALTSSSTGQVQSWTTIATADTSGKLNHTVGVNCQSGVSTTHTAFARGVASGRISNKAGASC